MSLLEAWAARRLASWLMLGDCFDWMREIEVTVIEAPVPLVTN